MQEMGLFFYHNGCLYEARGNQARFYMAVSCIQAIFGFNDGKVFIPYRRNFIFRIKNGEFMRGSLSVSNLERLRYWLRYELSGVVLFLAAWFGFIFYTLSVIAALAFTPFLLKVLFEEKKTGWITAYCIMVIIPAATVVLLVIFKGYSEVAGILTFVPLGGFYLFCFILKISIDDWISEKRAYIERISYKKPEVKFEDLWPRR
jgi:hypothetical protein